MKKSGKMGMIAMCGVMAMTLEGGAFFFAPMADDADQKKYETWANELRSQLTNIGHKETPPVTQKLIKQILVVEAARLDQDFTNLKEEEAKPVIAQFFERHEEVHTCVTTTTTTKSPPPSEKTPPGGIAPPPDPSADTPAPKSTTQTTTTCTVSEPTITTVQYPVVEPHPADMEGSTDPGTQPGNQPSPPPSGAPPPQGAGGGGSSNDPGQPAEPNPGTPPEPKVETTTKKEYHRWYALRSAMDVAKDLFPLKGAPPGSDNQSKWELILQLAAEDTDIGQLCAPPDFKADESRGWIWPDQTMALELTSCFGLRENPTEGGEQEHLGVDIGMVPGTDVRVARAGTVMLIQNQGKESCGLFVKVLHPKDDKNPERATRYCHLNEVVVTQGQAVTAGQVIAKSGGDKSSPTSGTSTGAHLHFEVWKNPGDPASREDPLQYYK